MNNGAKELLVIWRGKQIKLDINANSSVKEFALRLLDVTQVKADTMKLLIPASANKGSKLLTPFSAPHSDLSLEEAAVFSGKPIRMMGVFADEVEEVSHNDSRPDLRIIGFEEEEQRMKQRLSNNFSSPLKLPQGSYIFCDFRTLHLPGIELNPPPSEALKKMHMLASDPAIVAIMNKHRWRVGIMTEMAPVGYVGISPKCILGFNKNHGEEISLRLRTDDLKGFRKYESIKKTLLHELAHMVYSEHDSDFFALNKQLNEEAESLDWTKSRSYTLNGKRFSNIDEEIYPDTTTRHPTGQMVGGTVTFASARAASVAAAYNRIMNSSTSNQNEIKVETTTIGNYVENTANVGLGGGILEANKRVAEPDPDDALLKHDMWIDFPEHLLGASFNPRRSREPDPDDPDETLGTGIMQHEEFDPCDHKLNKAFDKVEELEPDPDDSGYMGISTKIKQIHPRDAESEPDSQMLLDLGEYIEPNPDELQKPENEGSEPDPNDVMEEIENQTVEPVPRNPYDSLEGIQNQGQQRTELLMVEPDPDDSMGASENEELQRIADPVAAICGRIQKGIEMLRSEATPEDAVSALQTLFKIIRNAIEYPDDAKFRRIRKSNPSFQKNVANYRAAMDLLTIVGFYEDVVTDELGRSEVYMVLRRNDPGLLWLAKTSLEVSIV